MSSPRAGIPLTVVREPTAAEFERVQAWLGSALGALDRAADEQARTQMLDILEGVDALHRLGLARLVALVSELGGRGMVDRLLQDTVVSSLLEMYDLPELDERGQVEHGMQEARQYVESRGGKVELLDVDAGRVRVRLSAPCGSCGSSAAGLASAVEESLRGAYAGFVELIVEEPLPVQPQVQPGRLPLRRPRWVQVGQLDELEPGELRAVWPEGISILLVRLGSEVYAYRNGCPPGSPLALQAGSLDGAVLTCPWHGCRYDLRTGKRVDGTGKLQVLPVAVHGSAVKVALGTEEIQLG